MKLVLIPGLGYDRSLFERLDLTDFNVEILDWIEPHESEILHSYAQRLFSKIDSKSENIILIGHSLGGIVAQEIASVNKIDLVILISSVKSRNEIPFFLRIISPLKVNKLFSKELCIKTIKYWGRSHGFGGLNEIDLFKRMVSNHSNTYLQWALKELSRWRGTKLPVKSKIIRIHGTKDKTLPYKLIESPDYKIDNGSHIFVYNEAKHSSELINKIITEFLK